MSQRTPESESLESRYQDALRLAQQAHERCLYNMGVVGVGLAGFFADMAYVSQRYYPYMKTVEQIQQGQMDAVTQEGLIASIGPFGFLVFCGVATLAVGYRALQVSIFRRQADRYQKEIEKQSKLPPTLRF